MSSVAPAIPTRTDPIIATLRSSTCIFEVRCEATGEWISPDLYPKSYTDSSSPTRQEMLEI
jgi:hypothetical protein